MATAILSSLSGIPVRGKVAMTGELSLRGRVLPIGGLKEKLMAAYSNGMTTVLIPEDNVSDLEEVDSVVKERLQIISVSHMDEVVRYALVHKPSAKNNYLPSTPADKTSRLPMT